jgi:Fe-S-cluster containining protein
MPQACRVGQGRASGRWPHQGLFYSVRAMAESSTSDTATVHLAATIGPCELKMSVSVPAGPTRLDDLLPLLQIVSDHVVASAENEAREQGLCVSCKKGCGACCRQLVPISPVEARDLARLVGEMPEPRRSQIIHRFLDARRSLEQAGLWERLNDRQSWPEDGISEMGLEYFRLGIACPFLEEESCSIHRDRPLTCREYLVTSPAENCSNPTPHNIEWLSMPAKVWVAAARCESQAAENRYLNWVPLIQALDWAGEHAEPTAEKNGPELLRQVIEALARSGNSPLSPAAASHQLPPLERQGQLVE